MNISNYQGQGSSISLSGLEYLQPEVNRPDLYESVSRPMDIHGPQAKRDPEAKNRSCNIPPNFRQGNLSYTLSIVVISAMVFIVLVAWTDVLRSWYDSKFVNSIIGPQIRSRIYFAITITTIGLLVLMIILLKFHSSCRR